MGREGIHTIDQISGGNRTGKFTSYVVFSDSDSLTICMITRLPSSWLSFITLLIVLGVFYVLTQKSNTEVRNMALVALEYEVFGRVQGVFFRKFTNEKAQSLGLRGWVKNTRDGTVTGELEGEQARVTEMRSWLETKGSPQSRIDRAEFRNVRQITKFSFENFKIFR